MNEEESSVLSRRLRCMVSAEEQFARALDPARYEVEVVHLGKERARLAEAERPGVNSVPALVIDRQPFTLTSAPRSRR